jgi:hypothetical protein
MPHPSTVDEHTWELETADGAGRMFNVYQDHAFWAVMEFGWCYAQAERGRAFIDLDTGKPWVPGV